MSRLWPFATSAPGQRSCERVYFDQATILRQLGLAHEPSSLAGRLSLLVSHPRTIARALLGRRRA